MQRQLICSIPCVGLCPGQNPIRCSDSAINRQAVTAGLRAARFVYRRPWSGPMNFTNLGETLTRGADSCADTDPKKMSFFWKAQYRMTKTSRARVANAIFLAVAFSVLVFAMYPGQFDGDAIGQYHQGINYLFDNSHSVMNAALLGILSNISGGPGPMFILQFALWIFGLFIFTDTLIIAERKIIGQFVAILSVTPFLSFDFFDIQKDALFSGLLAIIVGYAAKIFLMPAKVTIIGLFATFCIFVFALDVRQNAIFSIIPLWFLARPIYWFKLPVIATSVGIALLVFASAAAIISWVDNRVLHTNQSHIIYALVIFDLAGISADTGQDASHGLFPDFQEDVAKCYSPERWDNFLGGSCRPVGLAAQKLMADRHTRHELMSVWVQEIVKHPIAYLMHRARNFGCLIRVGCYE